MQKTSVSMRRTGAIIAFYVSYGFHKTKTMYSRTKEVKKGIQQELVEYRGENRLLITSLFLFNCFYPHFLVLEFRL